MITTNTIPATLDGKICWRLLVLARQLAQNAEYGATEVKYRLLPAAYNYTMNAARNVERQVLSAYKQVSREELNRMLTTERILDIGLLLDELVNAENIAELTELIKQHKKITG